MVESWLDLAKKMEVQRIVCIIEMDESCVCLMEHIMHHKASGSTLSQQSSKATCIESGQQLKFDR
jgi:hypothetical protein